MSVSYIHICSTSSTKSLRNVYGIIISRFGRWRNATHTQTGAQCSHSPQATGNAAARPPDVEQIGKLFRTRSLALTTLIYRKKFFGHENRYCAKLHLAQLLLAPSKGSPFPWLITLA